MSQPATDSESTQPVITTQPAVSPPPTPKRKVSIANDRVSESRYDNLAFEPCSKRKTSQVNLNMKNIWTNNFIISYFMLNFL